jgi:hypothetical protein
MLSLTGASRAGSGSAAGIDQDHAGNRDRATGERERAWHLARHKESKAGRDGRNEIEEVRSPGCAEATKRIGPSRVTKGGGQNAQRDD